MIDRKWFACSLLSVTFAVACSPPPVAPEAAVDGGAIRDSISSIGDARFDAGLPRDGEGTDVVPDGIFPPSGPPLDIGPIVTQPIAPPPLVGGTLLVTRDGHRAIAADPDRDRIHVVDLVTNTLAASITLDAGDQPARAAEDNDGRVHVVLRGAGAVATIDLATNTVSMRRAVCANPRGIAYDAAVESLQIVCTDGLWVTLPAAGGDISRSVMVVDDLRDIIVRTDDMLISRFRSAEVLSVARDGTIRQRVAPMETALRAPSRPDGTPATDRPHVAWRMLASRYGALLLHQQASTGLISTSSEGYAGLLGTMCEVGIAHPAASQFAADLSTPPMPAAIPGVLAVDAAFSTDESLVAMVFPGNALGRADRASIRFFLRGAIGSGLSPCGIVPSMSTTVAGVPTAIATASTGNFLVQTREPAALLELDPSGVSVRTIALSDASREDSGFELFHGNAGANIACASCHPEGGDDGHTWYFDGLGDRRTQSLRGGILATAPFHWSGDMPSFGELAHAVLGLRMGGGVFPETYVDLLANYVGSIPAQRTEPVADAAAVDRGRALFENGVVGCASCHSGALLTNNGTVDVGTGAMFQVPSLRGIRWRAPYLHNGCAPTLRDRFGACGGGESHGHTAALSTQQLDDLIAYLMTL